MVSTRDIQAACDDIVREFFPLKVVLFGSYAYGAPTDDSDVDLLVVMDVPEAETKNKAVEICLRLPHRFPMDLQVRTPQDIAFRLAHNDFFLREVMERGRVLYESNHARVGQES